MDVYAFPQERVTTSGGTPRGDEDLIDLKYDDDVQELEPMQTPWSPLGNDEHEFNHMRRVSSSSWTTITDSSLPSPTTTVQPAQQEEHILNPVCQPPTQNLPTQNPPTQTPPTHRINITAHFYTTLQTLLLNRADSGHIGTFRTTYDLTPSTSWYEFARSLRQDAVAHGLPTSLDVGREGLVMWITAKVVVKRGKKVKERIVELGREGWMESVKKVVRWGATEVLVGYYLTVREDNEDRGPRRDVGRRRQGVSIVDARALMLGA